MPGSSGATMMSREWPAGAARESAPVAGESARPMRKIFLLVGIAIAVFMVFTAYSIHNAAHERAQLTAIRDLYFPVLERADRNLIRIDKMEEQYLQAVELGDTDMVDKAGEIALQADKDFVEMTKLDPARAADIETIRRELERYRSLAERTSRAFLAHASDGMPALTQGMNQSLAALRTGLKAFRQSCYSNFTDTLAESQHDAKAGSVIGLTIGAMNIAFMGVLVYFIRNNVRMMSLVAEQNATLERRVAERTAELSRKNADIDAMLQNMKLGVATVVAGNRLHPEYSNYLRTIFDTDDVAGRELLEYLFARSDLGVDVKDQIANALSAILGEDSMAFEFNGHLLASEMTIAAPDGSRKIVQLDWSPIVNAGGTVEKILLISQDVTHLRTLELKSAQQKEEMEVIAKIIRTPAGKFNEFIESSRRYLAACRELIGATRTREAAVIASLFRNMHTIKGNARTFEFSQITDAAHLAEQSYDLLRKDPDARWDAAALLAGLDAAEAALERYATVNNDTLGRKGRSADLLTDRGAFVSHEDLAALKALAAAPGAAAIPADLSKAIGRLGLVSFDRLVSGVADALPPLAQALGKPVPSVQVVNAGYSFTAPFAEALKACFMHMVRNSMDHGIEAPQERTEAGKPAQGMIRFDCTEAADGLELRIADDGRGLALHKLHAKALATGALDSASPASPADVAQLIFRSGLTTADRVTDVSGRGVGMDAVRTYLEAQGARIRIEIGDIPERLTFAPFAFVIHVPVAAYA
jgi:HPt (histidine-containing phosphotransfer) domain-containing protein